MLVGRAFGCKGMYYSGDNDVGLHKTITKVCKSWGGDFFVEYVSDPVGFVVRWKKESGKVIHLTMYGMNLSRVEEKLRNLHMKYDLLIVVGSSKVPSEFYKIADMNVAVGHQPHSEVAALAIVLDRIQLGKELWLEFPDAKIKVVEQEHSKKVVRIDS